MSPIRFSVAAVARSGGCRGGFLRRRLAPVLALLLAGVTASAAAVPAEPGLRAGAATSNITPLFGVKLDGGIMQIGPATHVHDELHARCLVLDDGATRLAFVVCDTTMIATEVIDHAKRIIQEATGLAPDHVIVSATHSHSTPRTLDLKLGPKNDAYNDFFAERVADGVRRAINQLQPAKIGWGRGQKPEYVQTRRWLVQPDLVPRNPFGKAGDRVVMGASPRGKIEPAGPVDPEIFVLSVRHLDDRPLAVLADYGLHYVGGVPNGEVSADYYGVFADEVQRRLGADRSHPPFVAMMANGTSGDVITPRVPAPYYERMQKVAEGLAEEVARICAGIDYHRTLSLAVERSQLHLGVRKPDTARLQWANDVFSTIKPGARLTRPQVYAREARYLADYPATVPVTMLAFRIGDLAIATAPCEVFAATGLAVKAQSPFKATFMIELANGYCGYLPTPEQHALGGYETWPARTAFLEIQAEPAIRAEALRLLHRLAAGRR
jgi:hypothetical protein